VKPQRASSGRSQSHLALPSPALPRCDRRIAQREGVEISGSISIEAPDERRAAELFGELVEFDAELIPAEQGHWEVAVRRDRDLDPLIAGVLEAVDRWLVACDLPSTRIRIDDHAFPIHRPTVRLG